ncbi:hypothetical protein [Frateuria sp. YIM B11624]|uniref:hypothetical protein n=1 Tax=Frateuria sp. YIM B11624 TaxID=3143185 RepID=UPI003C72422D
MADSALSELGGLLGDLADVHACAGHPNIEAALLQCRLILIEACVDDGVELDFSQLGVEFGVIDDGAH